MRNGIKRQFDFIEWELLIKASCLQLVWARLPDGCNFSHVCERGPARNRELQYYHFIHGHNDSWCWMLLGATRTLLMAELTLVTLVQLRHEPSINPRSATRPSLTPDGLAQICCNLCTAVVCRPAALLSAVQRCHCRFSWSKTRLI